MATHLFRLMFVIWSLPLSFCCTHVDICTNKNLWLKTNQVLWWSKCFKNLYLAWYGTRCLSGCKWGWILWHCQKTTRGGLGNWRWWEHISTLTVLVHLLTIYLLILIWIGISLAPWWQNFNKGDKSLFPVSPLISLPIQTITLVILLTALAWVVKAWLALTIVSYHRNV